MSLLFALLVITLYNELMNFALVYLVHRLFYRLGDFFHHWYVDGSRRFGHIFISFLERLDRMWALRITLRYFFQPLYKDYTVIGRIMGVIFRSIRILTGGFIYLFFAAIFFAIYIAWLAVPLALLWYGLTNFGAGK